MKTLPSWLRDSIRVDSMTSRRPEGGFLLVVTHKDVGNKKVATVLATAADKLTGWDCEFQDGVGIVVRIPESARKRLDSLRLSLIESL